VELAITVQQIPAPTFEEGERTAFAIDAFQRLGLVDVEQDSLGNVYGRLPGRGGAPPVVLSAHLDTVFPVETALDVRRSDGLVHGPGIGDNSTGVAGMLALAEMLSDGGWELPADVWFVANVCEEGLGDLRGMRALARRFGSEARYIVVEGGVFGHVYHAAIAVTRYRVLVEAPGGHSWGAFGAPSAVHVLGRLIAGIDELAVPTSPRTTYNVGVIEGGTTINSIAQRASMLLDLRSEDAGVLADLVAQVQSLFEQAREEDGVAVTVEQVGDRPGGRIPRTTPLVQLATEALKAVGWQEVVYDAGSTDANIPLSLGWEAVCVGITRSGNAHRLDEFMDPQHIPQGMGQLLLLTLAAAGYEPRADG
jgi:acetylornithine deacetylase/succinyl-diaminopimelate desuccinylase-like protein